MYVFILSFFIVLGFYDLKKINCVNFCGFLFFILDRNFLVWDFGVRIIICLVLILVNIVLVIVMIFEVDGFVEKLEW